MGQGVSKLVTGFLTGSGSFKPSVCGEVPITHSTRGVQTLWVTLLILPVLTVNTSIAPKINEKFMPAKQSQIQGFIELSLLCWIDYLAVHRKISRR